jgi:3'(2'),5'-bisphosphate nucleotidase
VSEVSSALLALAIESTRLAGEATIRYYRQPVSTEIKSDGSPVTEADRAAHHAIIDCLASSQIPIVSEEGTDLLLHANEYWLVDPLDGTKDFIEGDGEFSVNVALIRNQRPVLGVVLAPATGELYCGVDGTTSWREVDGTKEDSAPRPKSPELRMAVSRFHDTPELDIFAENNDVAERIPLGSVLKYCRMAMAIWTSYHDSLEHPNGIPLQVRRSLKALEDRYWTGTPANPCDTVNPIAGIPDSSPIDRLTRWVTST